MRLIDADALIDELNSRIEAAIKWGVNAIADRDAEIKLRAEQAVATFCEASLTVKKMPTISPKDIIPPEWDEAFRIASEIRMAVGCKTAKECWELARNGGIQRVKTGRWTPVSERLPEAFEHCLWTTVDGKVIEHYWDGRISEYKAWMPLPEPYKGVE